jgi:hypothetical protein
MDCAFSTTFPYSLPTTVALSACIYTACLTSSAAVLIADTSHATNFCISFIARTSNKSNGPNGPLFLFLSLMCGPTNPCC